MKTPALLIAIMVFAILASCKKSGSVTNNSLIAKWSLVNDSVVTGTHEPITTNYIGVPGDYFDFRADGKVYVKEGAKYDTLAYHMTSDNSVIINTFNFNYPDVIDPFTAAKATIYNRNSPVSSGYNFRLVNLTK